MAVITVKGTGRVSAAPDEIVLTLAVEGRDKQYDAAVSKADEESAALNQAVMEAGFPEDELKTMNYQVRTEYEGVRDADGNYRNEFSAYVCRYDLKLAFPLNIEKLRELLSGISSCGAKPELYIRFGLHDPEAMREALLQETADNARRKAEVLAKAAGAKLGALVSINYHVTDREFYSASSYAEEASMDSGAPRMMAKNAAMGRFVPDDIDASDEASFTWELA